MSLNTTMKIVGGGVINLPFPASGGGLTSGTFITSGPGQVVRIWSSIGARGMFAGFPIWGEMITYINGQRVQYARAEGTVGGAIVYADTHGMATNTFSSSTINDRQSVGLGKYFEMPENSTFTYTRQTFASLGVANGTARIYYVIYENSL